MLYLVTMQTNIRLNGDLSGPNLHPRFCNEALNSLRCPSFAPLPCRSCVRRVTRPTYPQLQHICASVVTLLAACMKGPRGRRMFVSQGTHMPPLLASPVVGVPDGAISPPTCLRSPHRRQFPVVFPPPRAAARSFLAVSPFFFSRGQVRKFGGQL